jgi:hypothetical protein
MHRSPLALLLAFTTCACSRGGDTPGTGAPAGAPRSPGTAALETGANALQRAAPLGQIGLHLVGFHPLKDDPAHQMEAHHYCNQVNEDFAQCVLFDGDGAQANLNGIEHIVSEKLYATLSEQERGFWHPHNYEILSGTLVAPGVPAPAEKELMKRKLNSYGKTWHVWMTGTPEQPGERLPLGPARLGWALTAEGQVRPGLVEARDRRLGVDTGAKRRERSDLASLAHPQVGEPDGAR